jgi:hypothetical protein
LRPYTKQGSGKETPETTMLPKGRRYYCSGHRIVTIESVYPESDARAMATTTTVTAAAMTVMTMTAAAATLRFFKIHNPHCYSVLATTVVHTYSGNIQHSIHGTSVALK